ncbi:MAG TPA: dihydrolipoamide acetyltransferase family protein [Thermoplasmata archaeon]|nr:dihydrolipoamide acetyltransferase family protein [Thermoplasmata archaeon]
MAYEFRLPDIGEGVAEGEIVAWFVKEGDQVKEDAPLVSVLTDKANVEIPSPRGGRIAKLHARVGEKVKVGATLVTFEGDGPTGADEVPSTAPSSLPPPTPVATMLSTPAPPPSAAPTGRVLASPAVRRMAAEAGVDLERVHGTGPGGRVTEADVKSAGGDAAPSPPEAPGARAETPTAPSPPAPKPAAPISGEVERVPIRGIRRVIAEHVSEAVHRAAHFTYVEEVDASELVRLRDRMARHVEARGSKLSYLPFILKGVVAGLRVHPWMNATMDDAAQELVVHKEYHIGIATAAPEGLIVPVIRNADRKSVAQLAHEIQELSERGKAGKLTRNELTGSTFTITSLGALGGLLATPILNYPEVAILGVHKIAKRAVVRPDGSVGVADMMNLSVSLDHRVLDGIVGAQFLAVVKAHLEDPHQLFVDAA